ncbi:MAG: hypothetical protein IKE22_10305, partial [Atopobiaceae bacterium]|nr:hypothetical protein [Atopobiaceae bacterium]
GGHGIAIGGVAHDDGFVVNMDETVNGTMRLGVSNPVEASNDNGILRIVNSGGYELSFGSNGRLTNDEGFNAKSGNITSNTAPSSDTTGSGAFRLLDSVGATPIGFLAAHFAASGNQYVRLHTQRVINGSLKQNQLNLGVSSSGDALVTISGTGAAAAWRDAIGAASSVLGTLLTDDVSTAVSVASGTWTTIGSVTLDPGLWLIEFTGVFTSNATGRRAIAVSNTANSAGNASEQRQGFVSANATNGTGTGLSGSRIFINQTSSSYVLRLNVYQNSGSALNVTGCIRAMRIE